MPNLNELREAVNEVCKMGIGLSIEQQEALKLLCNLAIEVIETDTSLDKIEQTIIHPMRQRIEVINRTGGMCNGITEGFLLKDLDKLTQALHDFRIYQAKKMAELNKSIDKVLVRYESLNKMREGSVNTLQEELSEAIRKEMGK